jgi:hypothetical protein
MLAGAWLCRLTGRFWNDSLDGGDVLQLYEKHLEYGEPRTLANAIRTRCNSWSSLAYWVVGAIIVDDDVSGSGETLLNCMDTLPAWRLSFGLACLWTGMASFLFHASLHERWRALDAGATMGAVVFPTGFSVARSLCASAGHRVHTGNIWRLSFALFVGVHLLARTSGWSDIVLPVLLVSQAAFEWSGALGASKTAEEAAAWRVFVALLFLGVLTRLLDMRLHRRIPLIWLGHACWHCLSSGAIYTLYAASRRTTDAFCLEAT